MLLGNGWYWERALSDLSIQYVGALLVPLPLLACFWNKMLPLRCFRSDSQHHASLTGLAVGLLFLFPVQVLVVIRARTSLPL